MVCAATGALLLRVAGVPAWDGTYAEDNGVFLVDGLVRPWHLLVPYSGYLELGPRVIGQFVASFLPIVDASAAYAITGALIAAKSIAYSDSASGVDVSTELFQRLGIADELRAKSREIKSERVGNVVARGEAEIGFQQISELLPIHGIDFVGPLPPELQKITVFSAGIVVTAKEPSAAKALIEFLASPAALAAINNTGLEPINSTSQK